EVGGSDLAIPFVEEVPADADAQDHKKNGGPDGDANHGTLTAARAGGWGEKTFGDRLNVTGRLSPAASMTTPTSGRGRAKRGGGAEAGEQEGGEEGARPGPRRGGRLADGGHLLDAFRGPAAPRVEQMAELSAIVLKVLKRGRGGAEGGVVQRDRTEPLFRIPGVLDDHRPSAVLPGRRADRSHTRRTPVQHAAIDPPLTSQDPR